MAKLRIVVGLLSTMVLAFMGQAASAQWQAAQLLSDAIDHNGSVKNPRVAVAANGGYHSVYRVFDNGPLRMVYRRFNNGSLGPRVIVNSGEFHAGTELAESGSGAVHMVWEQWVNGPEVGWSHSTNDGVSWSSPVEISSAGRDIKSPLIAPFGAVGSATMLMSFWDSGSGNLKYRTYNGTNWSGDMNIGSSANAEFFVTGMDRSPTDGSVFRSYGRNISGESSPAMRRFNGASWDPEIVVEAPLGFFARQSLAVNDSGQVMVTWDRNEKKHSKLYTPGSGWGPVLEVDDGVLGGNVTNIPGTNKFYVCYIDTSPQRARGRQWAGGGWLPAETISVGLSQTLIGDVRCDAAADGTIYGVIEHWAQDQAPRAYHTKRAAPPPGPTGTIAGVVRDQLGAPLPDAVVTAIGGDATVAAPGGTYGIDIAAGTYSVEAQKNFYTTQVANNVPVTASQTTTRDFTLTANPIVAATELTVVAANTQNHLSWRNSSSPQANGAVVRFSTAGFPSSPTDGQHLFDGNVSSNSTTQLEHTNLVNGTTYFYSVFAYFQDASRHYASVRTSSATPSGPADFDRDGDVDQSDFGRFQTCLTGSTVHQADPTCAWAKLDNDNDVDLDDFGLFQGCFSGADIPADPHCID